LKLSGEPNRLEPYIIVFTLWLLVFSSASQTMILSPILPRIGDELAIPDALLGTLISVYSIMVGIFAILAGPVSDKVGRRQILILGCTSMAIALFMHGLVTGYYSFITVRIVAGCAGGMLSGAAVSYIGDYFPYERRGWATGWVMSGSAFGQIFGIPMGILMADRWGFRSPFYLFAITMALTVLLLFLRVPQPDVLRSKHRLSVSKAAADYMAMVRRPDIAWAACAYFVMFLGVSIFVIYLPTWLERSVGLTGNQIALMFVVGGVANVLTGPNAGKLSDKIGRKGIILMSCVGLSILMFLTTRVITGPVPAYVFFFFTMILVAMRISPFSALLTALVSDERRGSLMSLTVALGQVGFALGGAIAGPLYADIGYGSNTVLSAAFVLIMGLIVWFFVPEPQRESH
jgi:predicted MFS family arabinose efflux permease